MFDKLKHKRDKCDKQHETENLKEKRDNSLLATKMSFEF